jgi:hypothetical protein
MTLFKIVRANVKPGLRTFGHAVHELRRNLVLAPHPSQKQGGVDHDDIGQMLFHLQPEELKELASRSPNTCRGRG